MHRLPVLGSMSETPERRWMQDVNHGARGNPTPRALFYWAGLIMPAVCEIISLLALTKSNNQKK